MGIFVPVFEGKVALTSFIFSAASIIIMEVYVLPIWISTLIEAVYVVSLLLIMYSLPIVQVVLCSHVLGSLFTIGAIITMSGEIYSSFGFYIMALSFFHFSEYIVTSIFNSHTLTIDSFLLNHSVEYVAAAIMSWLEFGIEYYFFPGLKSLHYVSIIGAIMVMLGESLRKLSMLTAGSNFTHLVQYRKRDGHKLVTSGVYSIFRHPSYVGWFVWSVGTQVLLCNPVCLVGYTVASWVFFKERIEDEEEGLILFFREDYIDYKRRVAAGIPFIVGVPMETAKSLVYCPSN